MEKIFKENPNGELLSPPPLRFFLFFRLLTFATLLPSENYDHPTKGQDDLHDDEFKGSSLQSEPTTTSPGSPLACAARAVCTAQDSCHHFSHGNLLWRHISEDLALGCSSSTLAPPLKDGLLELLVQKHSVHSNPSHPDKPHCGPKGSAPTTCQHAQPLESCHRLLCPDVKPPGAAELATCR